MSPSPRRGGRRAVARGRVAPVDAAAPVAAPADAAASPARLRRRARARGGRLHARLTGRWVPAPGRPARRLHGRVDRRALQACARVSLKDEGPNFYEVLVDGKPVNVVTGGPGDPTATSRRTSRLGAPGVVGKRTEGRVGNVESWVRGARRRAARAATPRAPPHGCSATPSPPATATWGRRRRACSRPARRTGPLVRRWPPASSAPSSPTAWSGRRRRVTELWERCSRCTPSPRGTFGRAVAGRRRQPGHERLRHPRPGAGLVVDSGALLDRVHALHLRRGPRRPGRSRTTSTPRAAGAHEGPRLPVAGRRARPWQARHCRAPPQKVADGMVAASTQREDARKGGRALRDKTGWLRARDTLLRHEASGRRCLCGGGDGVGGLVPSARTSMSQPVRRAPVLSPCRPARPRRRS